MSGTIWRRGHSLTRRSVFAAALAAAIVPALITGTGSAAPSFGTPYQLTGSGGLSEPGIDIGPDGTIFVNGIPGLPAHSSLWRLSPGAEKFERLVFPSPWSRLPGGGDVDIVIGADKRVYFLDLWGGSNSISRSEDNGATWVEGTPFTTVPTADRQWISLGKRNPSTGKDTVYVVYHQLTPPSWLMFSRSDDGGLTWALHRPVPNIPLGTASIPGQIVSDGDYVGFTYSSANKENFAFSTDAGLNWVRKEVTPFNLGADVLLNDAVALEGQHLWDVFLIKGFGIQVGHSADRGTTWDYPIDIPTQGTAIFPWIATRDGKVAVAWYEAFSSSGQPVTGDPNTINAEWRVRYTESTDGGATWTTPVDASPVAKRGSVCTMGLSCNGNRELGDFLQVAIDASGKEDVRFTVEFR